MRNYKGILVTFEKTAEGLGGTTQAQLLYENLQKAGIPAVLTREPGGTPLGQELRKILLHGKYKMSKATELFLLLADRSQHYKEVLKPALRDGKVVVCDRFMDSTLVYQGHGRGWKSAFLWRLHHASTGMLIPDMTFVLDGTPHIERDKTDRFESLDDAFHSKIRRGMLTVASKAPRYRLVDANQPIEVLGQQILDAVLARLTEQTTEPQETV